MKFSDLKKIFQNVQGSCLVLANGSHIDLLRIPLISGLTETDHPAGAFAITSDYTGSGYLFRSNGSHWVRESGSGGLGSLAEDANPALGGDLDLSGFEIIGQIETSDFVIDGGLL